MRYSANRKAIGIVFICLSVAALGYASLIGWPVPWSFVMVILWLAAVLVIKWVAPAIPWKEIFLCFMAILFIQFGFEYIGWALALATEKFIEFVCVAVFGAHWVKCGYIPQPTNHW
jgi:hypothetical protein